MRKKLLALGAAAVVVGGGHHRHLDVRGGTVATAALPTPTTPIEHVVVLFPENIRSTTTSGPIRTR